MFDVMLSFVRMSRSMQFGTSRGFTLRSVCARRNTFFKPRGPTQVGGRKSRTTNHTNIYYKCCKLNWEECSKQSCIPVAINQRSSMCLQITIISVASNGCKRPRMHIIQYVDILRRYQDTRGASASRDFFHANT